MRPKSANEILTGPASPERLGLRAGSDVYAMLHPDRIIDLRAGALPGPEESDLKEGCLKAALLALELEQKNYLLKIEAARSGPGDPANIPRFERRLEELKREFLELKETCLDAYVLPEKKTVRVFLGAPVKENALLDAEGSTRSGPFYHLAGIRGGDYGALKAPVSEVCENFGIRGRALRARGAGLSRGLEGTVGGGLTFAGSPFFVEDFFSFPVVLVFADEMVPFQGLELAQLGLEIERLRPGIVRNHGDDVHGGSRDSLLLGLGIR